MIRATRSMCGDHRTDEPRRAKAALRAVVLNHRILNRMKRSIGASKPFDRAHRFAVQLWQKQDARIERFCARPIRDHHATRAAIALITALFGSLQVARFAQPIKQSYRRICLG